MATAFVPPPGPAVAIPLSNGGVTLVSACDADEVRKYRWRFSRYVVRAPWVKAERRYTTLQIHRQIMGAPSGMYVDHINHDPRDNRRCNLRVVTPSQNAQNRSGASRTSRLQVRGVTYVESLRKYRVHVCVNNKRMAFGHFDTLEEAAARARQVRRELMTHAPDCRDGDA